MSRETTGLPQSHHYAGRTAAEAVFSLHRGYLLSSGWLESKSRNRCFANGEELPWLTFPCISFLERLDLRGKNVLEFGGGGSTLWFARRSLRITTFEPDKGWSQALESRTAHFDNVKITHAPIDNQIFSPGLESRIVKAICLADIVLVDGGNRNVSISLAAAHLSNAGLIIVDNSDEALDLAPGLQNLKAYGWVEIPFAGLGPLNPYGWQTSVFFKKVESIEIHAANGVQTLHG